MCLSLKRIVMFSAFFFAAITGSQAQQQGVIFFGERDTGCSYRLLTGELTADCGGLIVSILDSEAKLSFACVAPQAGAIWDSASMPFRLKSMNLDPGTFCYKFTSNNLPNAAFGSSGLSQLTVSPPGANSASRMAVWLYDKGSKQVSLCLSNASIFPSGGDGPFEPACQKVTIKE
jgi:hypothetical protein